MHGIESVALRFGNVYGPRQDPHGEAGVVAIFCGRILDAKPITVFGDGLQTRDYIYVSDVVDVTYRAATRALPPTGLLDARAFNVGTGVAPDVLRLVNVLMSAAKATIPVSHAPERPGEQRTSYLDVTKAQRLLGWAPSVSLEDGLARSFAWFAAQASRSA